MADLSADITVPHPDANGHPDSNTPSRVLSLSPAALTNNGVLVEYLQILKDRKTQVDAHIGLLEKFIADQPDSGQTDGCSQEAGGESPSP